MLSQSFIQSSPAFFPNSGVLPTAEFEALSSNYDLHFPTNLIIEQQRRIRALEDENKRWKDKLYELNDKLAFYEQERSKDPPKKKSQSRYWTPEEHQMFLDGLDQYGPKDVKAISARVGSRNATQVRTHAQKYFLRLLREKERETEREKERELAPGDGSFGSPMSPEDVDSPLTSEGTLKDSCYSPPETSDGLDPACRRRKIAEMRQTITPESLTLSLNDFTKAEQDLCAEGIKTFKGEDIEIVTEVIQRKLLPKRSLQETLQLVLILEDKIKSEKPNSGSRKRGKKSPDFAPPNKIRKMNDGYGFMKSSFSPAFTQILPSSFPTTYPSFSIKPDDAQQSPNVGMQTPPVSSPFYGNSPHVVYQPSPHETGVSAVHPQQPQQSQQAVVEESCNKIAFAPENFGMSALPSFSLLSFPQQSLAAYVQQQNGHLHQPQVANESSMKQPQHDLQDMNQQFIDISIPSETASPWMESNNDTVDSNILRVVSPRATSESF